MDWSPETVVIAEPPERVAKFDPSEARDDKGEWTAGGIGEENKITHPQWLAGIERPNTGALARYRGERYEEINDYLRQGISPDAVENPPLISTKEVKSTVTALDRQMKPLPDAITVWRGMGAGERSVALYKSLKVGSVITDKGFTSTSVDRSRAETFASDKTDDAKGTLFKILVPKGTPAIWADGGEQEMLLARGGSYRVTAIGTTDLSVYSDHPSRHFVTLERLK